MTDIDALIERLHGKGEPGTSSSNINFIWNEKVRKDAAAALERMRDELAATTSERTRAQQACEQISVRLHAAEAEVVQLREALTELLELSLNPAGMTPEIVSDDGKFANFIAENERKCEAAIANARRALAQRSE